MDEKLILCTCIVMKKKCVCKCVCKYYLLTHFLCSIYICHKHKSKEYSKHFSSKDFPAE